MEKRVLIATFLSMMIIFLFWQSFQKPAVTTNQQPVEKTTVTDKTTTAAAPAAIQAIGKVAPTTIAGPIEKPVLVNTSTSKISLGLKGGGIAAWQIKDKNGQWVSLTPTAATEKNQILALQTGQEPDLSEIIFKADKKELTLSGTGQEAITLIGKTADGLEITRNYLFKGDGNLLKTSIVFKNTTQAPLKVPAFTLWWGPGLNPLNNKAEQNTTNAWLDGKVAKKLKPEFTAGETRWAALDSQYFIVALIPEQSLFSGVISEKNIEKKVSIGLTQKESLLSEGETIQYKVDVYAGPKKYHTLKTLGPQLEKMVDFGFFWQLGKFVYVILEYINTWVHNYGWSIIILTLLMQVILLPLTLKSYKSMAEMQKLQPLMKQLQEKYKNEPQRLNVEVMNLYKAHKVNPFGGCLPMLLQLPIFLALFNTIRNAVELRNAPFIFWIKDLSLPDTIFSISGINMNVLPLLMGIGMFFQQKMTATDPQQAKMMMFMPVIFTVMFWSFPSGLVLYWFVNSLVSMIGQYVIMHKKPPKVEIVS